MVTYPELEFSAFTTVSQVLLPTDQASCSRRFPLDGLQTRHRSHPFVCLHSGSRKCFTKPQDLRCHLAPSAPMCCSPSPARLGLACALLGAAEACRALERCRRSGYEKSCMFSSHEMGRAMTGTYSGVEK